MSAEELKHTPWTVQRCGETGFAGGFDVYMVRDSRGCEIFTGKEMEARLIASAPTLAARVKELESALEDVRKIAASMVNAPNHSQWVRIGHICKTALQEADRG